MTAAQWVPSPNFGPRRDGAVPDLVVLHFTAMESARAALERLCDPEHQVSAHYLIGRNGTVWQLVAEDMRAWHAGAGAWGAVTDVNSHSIGIEIDNDGRSPFAEPAMAALERVLREVMARWSVRPDGVIGHSDCAPGRKVDPGARFDWARLARLGLATATPATAAEARGVSADPGQVDRLLQRVGYTASVSAEARLAAFRLRHGLPQNGGPTGRDIACAENLLARCDPSDRTVREGLPVDPLDPLA